MEGLLRIGELAARTGVSTHLLRVWEDRYGLLAPRRSDNGYRLYGDEDERRVREMQRLRAAGLAAAEAAAQVIAGTAAPESLERLRARLLAAVRDVDDAEAHAVCDLAFGDHDLEQVLDELVFPTLRHLGAEWIAGRLTIAHEHHASTLLRGRMLGLTRDLEQGRPDGPRPLAVLACPPYERHDIGLLAVGLMLHRAGWQVSFLGADTPVPDVVALARQLRANAVVLSGTDPRTFAAQLDHDADLLATLATLAIGGTAATAGLAARHSALLLTGTAGEAARLLSRTVERVRTQATLSG